MSKYKIVGIKIQCLINPNVYVFFKVVITRAKVKQVLVRTCHRITREIPKYKNYKGDSEEFKSKKKKKGNRLAREIKIMKVK